MSVGVVRVRARAVRGHTCGPPAYMQPPPRDSRDSRHVPVLVRGSRQLLLEGRAGRPPFPPRPPVGGSERRVQLRGPPTNRHRPHRSPPTLPEDGVGGAVYLRGPRPRGPVHLQGHRPRVRDPLR
eukprot:1140294-Prorocentrum_minimum.AAC.2